MDSELYEGWDGEKEYARFVLAQRSPKMDDTGAAMGLSGEAGEVLELFKKRDYHDVFVNREKFIEELGDVKFYLTMLQNELGITSEQVARANMAKLRKRYPNGFVPGGGIR